MGVRRRTRWAAMVAVVLLGVTACANLSGGGSDDPQGSWALTEGTVTGRSLDVPTDPPITLDVDGSQISGGAGCNRYNAEVSTNGGRWRVQEIAVTRLMCEQDVMTTETTYLAGLRAVDEAVVDGSTLTLNGRGVTLTYEAVTGTADE